MVVLRGPHSHPHSQTVPTAASSTSADTPSLSLLGGRLARDDDDATSVSPSSALLTAALAVKLNGGHPNIHLAVMTS